MKLVASGFRICRLQVKHGNFDLEAVTVHGHEKIMAQHGSTRGAQTASAGVLEGLARLQQGLVPDDAQTVDFFDTTVVVLNFPVPGNQLGCQCPRIGDGDGVRKRMDMPTRIAVFGQVMRRRIDEKCVVGHGAMVTATIRA